MMPIDPRHVTDCETAKDRYIASLDPANERSDWLSALRTARRIVADALRASSYLTDIAAALRADGRHQRVFRHLLSPPKSQDQFRLICSVYSKHGENRGRPVRSSHATQVEAAILQRLDPSVGQWLRSARVPTRREIEKLLDRVAPLIASQEVSTATRNRLAADQERHVIDLLVADGWTQLPSSLIDTRAAVPARNFMYKTRFATRTTAPQEVDVACGLQGTYVLALECKVTNDETNSIKRINDVLKKSEAWRSHWGSFVHTAALLQGVIRPADVQRLDDAGVHIFWSHDMASFSAWLRAHV